jgi:hypothetical protein
VLPKPTPTDKATQVKEAKANLERTGRGVNKPRPKGVVIKKLQGMKESTQQVTRTSSL